MVHKTSGQKVKKSGQTKFTMKGRSPEPPTEEIPQVQVLGTFNIQTFNNLGSNDSLLPSFPTPGDVRRMFGIDVINAEPEYVQCPDPAPWAPRLNMRPNSQAIPHQNVPQSQAPPQPNATNRNYFIQNASCGTEPADAFQTPHVATKSTSDNNLVYSEEIEASQLLITSSEIERLKKEVLVFALFLASKMNREHWIQFSKVYDSAQSNELISITDVEEKVKRLAESVLGKKAAREKLLSCNLDGFNNWLEMAKVLLSLYSKGVKTSIKSSVSTKKSRISLTQRSFETKNKYVIKKNPFSPVHNRKLIKPKPLLAKPKISNSKIIPPSELKKNETGVGDEPERLPPIKKIFPVKPVATAKPLSKEITKSKELMNIIEKAETLVKSIKKKPQPRRKEISIAVQATSCSDSSYTSNSASITPSDNSIASWKNQVEVGKPFDFIRAISFGPSTTYLKRFSRSLSGSFIFAEPFTSMFHRSTIQSKDAETNPSLLDTPPASPMSNIFMDEEGDAFVDPSHDNIVIQRENKTEVRFSTFSGQTDAIENETFFVDVTDSFYKMSKCILVRTTKLSAFLILVYCTIFIIVRGFRGELDTSASVNQELTLMKLMTQVSECVDDLFGGVLHLGGDS